MAHLLDIILQESHPQGMADAGPDPVKEGRGSSAIRHAPGTAHSCYGGSGTTQRSLETVGHIVVYNNAGNEDK